MGGIIDDRSAIAQRSGMGVSGRCKKPHEQRQRSQVNGRAGEFLNEITDLFHFKFLLF
jgi:hypothetical protein